MKHRLPTAFALLLFASCGDDDCAITTPCGSGDVPLAAALALPEGLPERGGLPAVTGTVVAVEARLVNPQDTATHEAVMRVWLEGPEFAAAEFRSVLPPLPPHSRRAETVLIPVPEALVLGISDERRAQLSIETTGGGPVASASTERFRLLRPVLELLVEPQRDTLVFGGTWALTVSVTNRSMFVPLRVGPVRFRLKNPAYDVTFPFWDDVIDIPEVAPGETLRLNTTPRVPPEGGNWLDGYDASYGEPVSSHLYAAAQTYRLEACTTPWLPCTSLPRDVIGRLDLEPCTGATARLGATTTTTVRCRDAAVGDVGVWRFSATAGQHLFLEVSNPGGGGMLMVLRRDGSVIAVAKTGWRDVVFSETGTYYAAFWSAQNPLVQPVGLAVTVRTF